MQIRRAVSSDIPDLLRLLGQVLTVHHEGRPDLFKSNATKYTAEELDVLLSDEQRPIFAATDDMGRLLGYAFCIFQQHKDDNILTDIRTLYVDDICVDEACRRQGVATALYKHVETFARENGCYNLTLNVWAQNPGACAFYTRCGLTPQKTTLEMIL